MRVPSSEKNLIPFAQELVDTCAKSRGSRNSLYQSFSSWLDQGKGDGDRSLCNTLYNHCDRLASHLFSPTELRFTIDFDATYDEKVLAQAEFVGNKISHMWENQNIDIQFGDGVSSAIPYGASILKQHWYRDELTSSLLMPWQFSVLREDLNNLEDQEVICESNLITMPEVVRAISHLPDWKSLYCEIEAHAFSGSSQPDISPATFFHQILSTSTLDTSGNPNTSPRPGGIVNIQNPSYIIQPQVDILMTKFHEIWVKDEEIDDWCTIKFIEPNVIIAPYGRRKNLLCPKTQPYTLIQPNYCQGYLWGRSELTDLLGLQEMLTSTLTDIKKLSTLQFDKILAFVGSDGMTDEQYSDFRGAGFCTLPQGATVQDLTPKMPETCFQLLQLIGKLSEQVSGFDNILSGSNEPGVRAGTHADTLLKTASPRLRDRSLRVERQCAEAGDKTLAILRTYDSNRYYAGSGASHSEFLIHQLPDDARVKVDSHSSSPIYESDHRDLIGFGVKHGFIDGESAIDMLPFPKKKQLIARWRHAQEAKAQMIQQHPELLTKKGSHI